jgi:hypothetical protein
MKIKENPAKKTKNQKIRGKKKLTSSLWISLVFQALTCIG